MGQITQITLLIQPAHHVPLHNILIQQFRFIHQHETQFLHGI